MIYWYRVEKTNAGGLERAQVKEGKILVSLTPASSSHLGSELFVLPPGPLEENEACHFEIRLHWTKNAYVSRSLQRRNLALSMGLFLHESLCYLQLSLEQLILRSYTTWSAGHSPYLPLLCPGSFHREFRAPLKLSTLISRLKDITWPILQSKSSLELRYPAFGRQSPHLMAKENERWSVASM